MSLLKSLNKEQWTAAAAAVIGSLWLAMGLSGGIAPGSETLPAPVELNIEPPAVRPVEFPDEKFDRYWSKGRNPWGGWTVTKLPIPVLKAPEPREEELPAPLFRPGPLTEVYNALAVKSKYPVLAAGPPAVGEAELPPAAELDTLKKLEEPQAAPRVDRRGSKERDFFTIYLKPNGAVRKEATQYWERGNTITIINKATGQREEWDKDKLLKWEYNRTYLEQYQLDAAKIQPGPKEAPLRTELAKKLVGQGMIPEAKDELTKAIAAKKDHLEAIVLLGQLFVEAADFEGAVSLYDAGIAAGAPAGDLHCEIGRCLRALSFHEGAAQAFERALEASPRHQGARLALARSLLDLGRHAQAVELANDFFTRFANAPDTTVAQKAEANLVRGLAYLRAGDLVKSKADFTEALRLDPQSGEALNALGAALALEGNAKDAGSKFAEAIRANQYATEAWTNLGALLLLGGKWDVAEAIFREAEKRDPTSVEAVVGQAMAQLMGQKKDAGTTLERAVQMDPRHVQARAALGHLRLREGLDEDALTQFVAALRSDYYYLPAYSGAAAAYLRTSRKLAAEALASRDEGRSEELRRQAQEQRVNAETLLKTVKDFDANRPNSWIALGCAYAVMNRPGEAQQALRTASMLLQNEKKPIDPVIFYVLGYVEYYYGLGESEEARLDMAHREFTTGAKLKGTLTDPHSTRVVADCESAVEEIENWKVTSLRVNETFDRESSRSIGNGWIEGDKKYGIEVTLENTKEKGGRCKFSGRQAIADWGVTTLTRDIPGENFYAMEATFYPEKVENTEYGLSIYVSKQGESWVGFHVGVDRQGKVRFNPAAGDTRDMDRKDMSLGWMEVGAGKVLPPNPKELTIRVTKGEGRNRAPVFTIWFWDAVKGEWIPAQKDVPVNLAGGRATNWRVGIFGRAWNNQEYTFTVDNIRVYERARR